jgi:hypothetical protein
MTTQLVGRISDLACLIDYDRETEAAALPPTGAERVCDEVIPKVRKRPT